MIQMQHNDRPLWGWSGNSNFFRFAEHSHIDMQSVESVLRGRLAGVMFRGVVPESVCRAISDRFWNNDQRQQRVSDAPGYFIGAYHYDKPTSVYLDESERSRTALASVLDVPGEPSAEFTRSLRAHFSAQGVQVRTAEHGGRKAAEALIRSWTGTGRFSLAPHDDEAQCLNPLQSGFEIQRVAQHTVCALNICIENGGSGWLSYWNIRPSVQSKRRLGLEFSGSPYAPELLEGVQRIRLPVRRGDMYLFHGGLVHAVEPTEHDADRRSTIAYLLGFNDTKTIVKWT